MLLFLLTLTIKRLLRSPLRSALSILQVALGGFAVLVVLALIAAKNQAALSSNTFVLNTARVEQKNGTTTTTMYSLFSSSDLKKLLQTTSSLEQATVYEQVTYPTPIIEASSRRFKLQTIGVVGAEFAAIMSIDFVAGGFFSHPDVESGKRVVVISQTVAKLLFGNTSAVGKPIGIPLIVGDNYQKPRLIPYNVVGVFKDLSPNMAGLASQIHLFRPPTLEKNQKTTTHSQLLVKAKSNRLLEAKDEILAATKGFYQKNQAFIRQKGALTIASINENLLSTTGDSNQLDSAISVFGVISLVILAVCSISIFSIQMVSVAEQTREIGLQKALGASNQMIRREYLFSSGILALAGALLGLLLAILLIPTLAGTLRNILPMADFSLTPLSALAGLVVVVAVGVIFGLYPALLASRLRPVEALKDT